ncbi:chitinase [Cordyceps fumosorosea ARSEF 2679]|uniref:Chitinase n=1 Tax=Cordyceps fumosorosea (strain ARSEF 2679) TaxID=1081104 RepID=A0A167Q641_CORFA|nr:chitinase [Cordyceps fumosorosea ARSEF 2679]OAA57331.1 chitinase [Cordyceps fumosorosea ARSEF 2679]
MKLSVLSLLSTGVASVIAGSSSVCPGDNSHATGADLQKIIDYKKGDHQLMAGYFRSWRDTASGSGNKVSMLDLPDCLDIAFVFPEGDEPDSFWTALNSTYAPALRKRGTKVVRSLGIAQLINTQWPNTPAGWQGLADALMKNVDEYGLDGLDIDVEQSLSSDQLKQATGVFNALSKKLGPKSGTDKILIFDTNGDGSQPLWRNVYPTVSYVLIQSYGRSVSGLQRTYDSFKAYVSSKQYLIGFSFYEENGANWGDTTTPMTSSRAWQYAKWQPSGATKGGIFSYAIDRDGVAIGDDTIQPTDFTWTRKLIGAMNP